MNARTPARTLACARRVALASAAVAALTVLPGCGTDDGVTTSSVGVSYGAYYGPGYYGPGYYGGYYEPYPPVVVVPPGDGSNRPDRPGGGDRPTTLPADVGGPSAKPAMAPSRPSTTSRPTSRPSPRPAPRPMPRGGGMRR
jgi:hypothetical protein